PRHNQILRQPLFEIIQSRIDRIAELPNDLSGSHLYCERNSAAATPLAALIAPGVEIQVSRWTIISADDVHDVSQVDGGAGGRRGHQNITDVLLAFELAAGVNTDVLSLRL